MIVDPARLRQVLLNLAGNGVKFTEAGGVTVSVERGYSSDREIERIVFSVMDSGPGIPPEEAERIFGEFEQADSALTRRHGGAGLGLAISRRIVRRMGSDIVLDRAPGGGAIFRFALDLKPVARTERSHRRVPDRARRTPCPDRCAATAPSRRSWRRNLGDAGASARIVGIRQRGRRPRRRRGGGRDALSRACSSTSASRRRRQGAGADSQSGWRTAPGGGPDRARHGAARSRRCAASGFDAYLVRPVRRSSLLRIAGEIIAATGGFHVDPSDARPARPDTRRRAQRSLDILLAEDNEINALLVRAVLEGLGHSVTEVRDGSAAVAAATAADAHFGVVLMDLHMPRLDGIGGGAADSRARVRRRRPAGKAVIVALTADVLAETRAEAAAAGIDAVLAKPIAPDSLRRVLADLAA